MKYMRDDEVYIPASGNKYRSTTANYAAVLLLYGSGKRKDFLEDVLLRLRLLRNVLTIRVQRAAQQHPGESTGVLFL